MSLLKSLFCLLILVVGTFGLAKGLVAEPSSDGGLTINMPIGTDTGGDDEDDIEHPTP
jgi:hypothetical protein